VTQLLLTPRETASLYRLGVAQLLVLERKGAIPPALRLTRKTLRFRADEHPAALNTPA